MLRGINFPGNIVARKSRRCKSKWCFFCSENRHVQHLLLVTCFSLRIRLVIYTAEPTFEGGVASRVKVTYTMIEAILG